MVDFILYKPKQAILLPTSFQVPPDIEFKEVEFRGKAVKVVKHTLDNTIALRNTGVEVPSPIRFWDWPKVKNKFDPFEHQKVSAEFATLHRRCALLLDLGLGKTVTTLMAAHWMMEQGIIKKVLIFAPLSTLQGTWAEEMFSTFLPYGRSYAILHGTSEKRMRLLNTNPDFLIANHHFLQVAVKETVDQHGTKHYSVNKGFEKILDVDLIIWDESSELRNYQTAMVQSLSSILKPETRLWLLSGRPTPSGPVGAWSQAKLINPNNVPKFFGAWRRMVCYEIKQGQFSKWVPKPGSDKMVFEALQPAIQYSKEDAIDLPPMIIERRHVEMTPSQKKAYNKMLKEMQTEVDGVSIDANNAAHKVLMLRQIAAGAVKFDEEFHQVDCKNRIAVITETLEQYGGKIVVFVPFIGILNMLKEELTKYFKKEKSGDYCEVIHGGVNSDERGRILTEFNQKGCGARVLICQINSVSHGTQMQGDCSVGIYYSPPTGNNAFAQSKARLHRTGQKNTVTLIYITSCAMEEKLFDKLDQDENFQQSVLDIYTEAREGMLEKA